MKLFSLCIAAFFVTMLVSSCSESVGKKLQIDLPETPVLTMNASWAVIVSSHLRLREQPDAGSRIITTLWRGYVLEVVAKQNRMSVVDGESDFWYQIGFDGLQGWVFGAYLSFYSSRSVAVSAGEALRK